MTGARADVADEKHRWLLEQYTEIASLAGGLAHEIKNPLSTLTLNLQLLSEDFADPENQRERRALQKIGTLQNECRRLEEILDAFLRFARISELNPTPADLNQVVSEVIDFQSSHADSCNVVLRADLHAELPNVRLDGDLIKQAVLNLVLNALNVMEDGGELILKTRFDDRFVYLDVIDTGPGMNQEVMRRIFKPFFSTRRGGNGLGLPTTKKIVEGHHGRLLVESEPGKGTAFTIALPIAD